ncbi:penicillin-binding protein 2 [Candidatus Nomurabacteria bacterium]|nr:penicillin-binding protein 2 [Candidatus Nomurabacteria bacterium]
MQYVKLNKNSQNNLDNNSGASHLNGRTNLIKFILIGLGFLLIGRLFYIQIIKHDYYQGQALAEHVKKYEIPAKRGLIYAMDGDKKVPIVLNEDRYEIYADPRFVENKAEVAKKVSELTGLDKVDIEKKLNNEQSRYVILAKKVTADQKDKILSLKDEGVGAKEISIRNYPQGEFASQLLGFVNDDQQGQYGIEQSLNDVLAGKSGQLKAITDIRGVPLAVNNDNIQRQPQNGQNVNLTIDIGMQKITEDALAGAITRTRVAKASAVLIDADNGQVKAMANLPSFNPTDYQKVTDASLFSNLVVSGAWEPGSVMKPLILGAALNEGTLNPGSTYYDSMSVQVDDRTINNSYPWGARTYSVQDIITKSLNTGAVHILKSLGGGDISDKARQTYYKYLTDRYRFNEPTGVEQTGESAGKVIGPDEGYGLRVRYANMSFGQGLTVTPIQLASAYASLINGGKYYQPTLVESVENEVKKPTLLNSSVVSTTTSGEVKNILKTALETNNKAAVRPGYALGAKTGTAEIADGSGNYKTDAYNGVYVGFISGQNKTYVLLVRLDEPKSARFASSEAATTWTEISNKLLDTYSIKPNAN